MKDVAAPEAPKVNIITDQDTKITGNGEKGTRVSIVIGGKEIGSSTVNRKGNFIVDIPKQSAGTEIAVMLTDKAGNISKPMKTKVEVNLTNQGRLIGEAKQAIDRLFVYSIQANYSYNFITLKKNAIQVHVTTQLITEAKEKVRMIPDGCMEKALFQNEIECAEKLLEENKNEQIDNPVRNGAFEFTLDNWKVWVGPNAIAPEVKVDGDKSLNVIKINPNTSIEQTLNGLEKNTAYELTVYAKTENNENLSVGLKNTGTTNVNVPVKFNDYGQVKASF